MEANARGFCGRFAGYFRVQRFCGAFEIAHVVYSCDCRRKLILDQAFFFAWPKTGENQDGLANPGFAQLDAFVRAGDAEPFGTGFLQGFGNRDGTQAIGIGLNDSQNSSLPADVAADYAQVVQDCLERNLRPNRPAFEMDGLGHCHLRMPDSLFGARMKSEPSVLNSAFR